MSRFSRGQFSLHIAPVRWINGTRPTATLLAFLLAASSTALAQSGSPFDTGFTAIQTLFTGTVAKVASLVAIVIGGYGFAHGEPAPKKLQTSDIGFFHSSARRASSRAALSATYLADETSFGKRWYFRMFIPVVPRR